MTGELTRAEKRDKHQLELMPPDGIRIAKEGGPASWERYQKEGIVAFRRVIDLGEDNYYVQEGYVVSIELPNGRTITNEVHTNKYPLDWCKKNP